MQIIPGPGTKPNARRDAPSAVIAWCVLVVVSPRAALVAYSLMFVSLKLSDELVAANP